MYQYGMIHVQRATNLTQQQAKTAKLVAAHGASFREAAKVLGIDVCTAHRHWRAALKNNPLYVRSLLEKKIAA